MSTAGLFAAGVAVTVVIAVALGVCIWGAILDGRYDRERRHPGRGDSESLRPVPIRAATAASTDPIVKPAA
jgi:hypothetical protein